MSAKVRLGIFDTNVLLARKQNHAVTMVTKIWNIDDEKAINLSFRYRLTF